MMFLRVFAGLLIIIGASYVVDETNWLLEQEKVSIMTSGVCVLLSFIRFGKVYVY